jgi:hypothetical protein
MFILERFYPLNQLLTLGNEFTFLAVLDLLGDFLFGGVNTVNFG